MFIGEIINGEKMDEDIVIQASNLTKFYGKVLAVDHINFEVKRGEIFGFLGRNGAGKTTTIRMLTGIIKPSSGNVRVMGFDIEKQTLKVKQIIGVVPEVSNAYIDLSAWSNMMFQGELYGLSTKKSKEIATELLKNFGLYERKNELVRFFSKGMKQRLIICLALLNQPQILFLDEPTVGLDVQSATIIKEKLRQINKEGVTIFLTTHNMEEANMLCDRIAIINKGKIVAIDTPEKLKLMVEKLQKVIVAFNQPINLKELDTIPGVNKIEKLGDKIQLHTAIPGKVIFSIVDFAKQKHLDIVSLNVVAPTLEDAFIKLTEDRKESESGI